MLPGADCLAWLTVPGFAVAHTSNKYRAKKVDGRFNTFVPGGNVDNTGGKCDILAETGDRIVVALFPVRKPGLAGFIS